MKSISEGNLEVQVKGFDIQTVDKKQQLVVKGEFRGLNKGNTSMVEFEAFINLNDFLQKKK